MESAILAVVVGCRCEVEGGDVLVFEEGWSGYRAEAIAMTGMVLYVATRNSGFSMRQCRNTRKNFNKECEQTNCFYRRFHRQIVYW